MFSRKRRFGMMPTAFAVAAELAGWTTRCRASMRCKQFRLGHGPAERPGGLVGPVGLDLDGTAFTVSGDDTESTSGGIWKVSR